MRVGSYRTLDEPGIRDVFGRGRGGLCAGLGSQRRNRLDHVYEWLLCLGKPVILSDNTCRRLRSSRGRLFLHAGDPIRHQWNARRLAGVRSASRPSTFSLWINAFPNAGLVGVGFGNGSAIELVSFNALSYDWELITATSTLANVDRVVVATSQDSGLWWMDVALATVVPEPPAMAMLLTGFGLSPRRLSSRRRS